MPDKKEPLKKQANYRFRASLLEDLRKVAALEYLATGNRITPSEIVENAVTAEVDRLKKKHGLTD